MTVTTLHPDIVRQLDLAVKQGPKALRREVRSLLSLLPTRSRVLIPEVLPPVAVVALVLKARAKELVPVWWDGNGYQLFPRSA